MEQGQRAILTQGSKIRMLTYSLYFLLPIQDEKPKRFILPQKSSITNDNKTISEAVEPALKKIKKESIPEFLDRPLLELLTEFFDAVDNNTFERKHSLISNAILAHVINDACADVSLIEKCKKEGGLQRSEVIQWIENHETYGRYVRSLLKHLEVKSYHQNLSKAMAKVGFERVGSSGRHVKWLIPGIKIDAKSSASKTSTIIKSKDISTSEKIVDEQVTDTKYLDKAKEGLVPGSMMGNTNETIDVESTDPPTRHSSTQNEVQAMELEAEPCSHDDMYGDIINDSLESSMNNMESDQLRSHTKSQLEEQENNGSDLKE